jgi:hypothetical protein
MIEVVERVGRPINEHQHPETMTVLKLGRDYDVPPVRCR